MGATAFPSKNMSNKFTLSFINRQLAVQANSWVTIWTTFGEFIAQYIPCSESFRIGANGCNEWTYTFCVQDSDLPSGIESVCEITPAILVSPYLTANDLIFLEDTLTVDVVGAGTENIPYNFNVIIDPDIDNDLEGRANGLFVSAEGSVGPEGPQGDPGEQGDPGLNGTDGTDGTDGSDGSAGANGAGPPVGSTFTIPSLNAPTGTLPLWGQLINRISFPDLFDFAVASGNILDDATWLGDPNNVGAFSSGDGVNTFRLPNTRGYFMRMWNSDDQALYPDDARVFASVQEDSIKDHTHTLGNSADSTAGANQNVNADGSIGGVDDGIHTGSVFGTDQSTFEGDIETRPKNIAWMHVIQASSIV